MERLVQYLDEIEDLIYAVALKAERIRMALQFFLFMFAAITLQICGVIVALTHPPLALAMVSLMSVGMLFRAAIGNSPDACENRSTV